MTLGPPIRPPASKEKPEWQPVPGRPCWFISTDGKKRWMYAPEVLQLGAKRRSGAPFEFHMAAASFNHLAPAPYWG